MKKHVEKMSAEESAEEFRRCKEGYNGMSGDEYFFLNYCYVNGKLPDEYTPEKFKEYQDNIQEHRDMMKTKFRRHGPKPSYYELIEFIKEYPIEKEEAFPNYLGISEPDTIQNSCPNCGEKLNGGIFEQIKHYNPDECPAYPKEKITLESIAKVLKELEKSRPKSKGYQAIVKCKTRGVIQVDFSELTFCKDPECGFCVSFKNALEALVNEDLEKIARKPNSDLATAEALKDIAVKKVEPLDFDERNHPYDRQQKRYQQRYYRRKK